MDYHPILELLVWTWKGPNTHVLDTMLFIIGPFFMLQDATSKHLKLLQGLWKTIKNLAWHERRTIFQFLMLRSSSSLLFFFSRFFNLWWEMHPNHTINSPLNWNNIFVSLTYLFNHNEIHAVHQLENMSPLTWIEWLLVDLLANLIHSIETFIMQALTRAIHSYSNIHNANIWLH